MTEGRRVEEGGGPLRKLLDAFLRGRKGPGAWDRAGGSQSPIVLSL